MIAMGETIGVFHVLSSATAAGGSPPSDLDDALQELAISVSGRLAVASANLTLRDKLRHLSIRDPLTNLFNRRYMEETLDREISRAKREKTLIGVLQIDVDHFKTFNDAHGHDAGDAVLETIAGLFLGFFREADVPCRYGGEEFTIILPGASLESAEQRAEQLRDLVARTPVPYKHTTLTSPTLSCGVAVFPDHGATSRDLIGAADSALYTAKQAGRDRVVTAPST